MLTSATAIINLCDAFPDHVPKRVIRFRCVRSAGRPQSDPALDQTLPNSFRSSVYKPER
jgi:hypothetical protein